MAKTKRPIEDVDEDSDDGFVVNDDGKAPKTKKTKNALSRGRQPRRVNISEFKNTQMVNIREYYEKNDEYLPGKKINSSLKKQGINVDAVSNDEEEEEEPKENIKKTSKAKKESKANFESTDDEEAV
ncbi:hypothetical protein B0O99DRAFT_593725 [Bisporella sp. PMI_857]|nr:hypothetical protein B0O99DRAFT_593725 [Bisporella sp. PMI_857]